MGQYSDIVKSKNQGDEPENQKTIKPESNKAIEQQNNKTGNVENNKSGNTESIITSNSKSIKTSKPDLQKTIQEDMVNLSIKVPRRLRQKWVAESRLRGTTLTAIITDYLKTELGE